MLYQPKSSIQYFFLLGNFGTHY